MKKYAALQLYLLMYILHCFNFCSKLNYSWTPNLFSNDKNNMQLVSQFQ